MKRSISLIFAIAVCVGSVAGQSNASVAEGVLETPDAFREAVDIQLSLADLDAAVDDMTALEEIANRVVVLEGIASSITVYSEDPSDFYVELELVGGRWSGVESVEMYKAYIYIDDPTFAGRLAERPPRDPDPSLIVRNDRVLIAGRLVSLAEDPEGRLVPVLQAYDLRPIR